MATAERPALALRIEMTVGMSAPPMGRINRTPKSSERAITPVKAAPLQGAAGETSSASPRPAATRSRPILTTFWPG